MTDQIYSPESALAELTKAVRMVTNAERVHELAKNEYDGAQQRLTMAQERFDAIREEVFKYIPALETGYATHETVALVDGKITIVEED